MACNTSLQFSINSFYKQCAVSAVIYRSCLHFYLNIHHNFEKRTKCSQNNIKKKSTYTTVKWEISMK